MLLPAHFRFSIVESLRDREVACSATDRQGSKFLNPVSGGQCHLIHLTNLMRPTLAQFSLYVRKGGLNPTETLIIHF